MSNSNNKFYNWLGKEARKYRLNQAFVGVTMSISEKREILFASITIVVMTIMNISGLPATLFVNIRILDWVRKVVWTIALSTNIFGDFTRNLYGSWCICC